MYYNFRNFFVNFPKINFLRLNSQTHGAVETIYELTRIIEKSSNDNKLLILDEADNITPKAQRLINSIMEKYPTTRFAFTCNNSSAVIESIQSRCIIIRFTKPPIDKFIERIKSIVN